MNRINPPPFHIKTKVKQRQLPLPAPKIAPPHGERCSGGRLVDPLSGEPVTRPAVSVREGDFTQDPLRTGIFYIYLHRLHLYFSETHFRFKLQ